MSELSRRDVLRFSLFAAGATALAPAIAACSGGSSDTSDGSPSGTSQGSPSASAPAAGKTPVSLAMWGHDENVTFKYFEMKAAELSAQADSPFTYSLTFSAASPDDTATKALAAYAAKQGIPDMLQMEVGSFPKYMTDGIADGVFVDQTDVLRALPGKWLEARNAAYAVDGKYYGFETGLPLGVYYFRTDEFAKYKITSPVESWDDLLGIADKTLIPAGKAVAQFENNENAYTLLLLQRGGHVFDQSGTNTLDSQESLDALTLLERGLKSGAFIASSDFYGAGQAAFKNGKVLGAFYPDWFNGFVLQGTQPGLKGKWNIQPMPKFANGGTDTSLLGGTGIAISKDGPHVDASSRLLSYAYGSTGAQVDRFSSTTFLPTNFDAFDDPRMSGYSDAYLGGQKSAEVFKGLLPHAPTFYQNAKYADARKLLVEELSQLYAAKQSAEQTQKNIVKKAKQRLGA